MKKIFVLFALVGSLICSGAIAQTIIKNQAEISNVEVSKDDETIYVSMDIDISELKMKSNNMFVLTAYLEKGAFKAEFPAIKILGRKKNISYQRNISKDPSKIKKKKIQETIIRKSKNNEQIVRYTAEMPYKEWMAKSDLLIRDEGCGCPATPLRGKNTELTFVNFGHDPFNPKLAYMTPLPEPIKKRSSKASAYLNFQVNKTVIDPNLRNNHAELTKVRNLIDETRSDANLNIQSFSVHGYASPEGSYELNGRLALGRSNAMKNYVQSAFGLTSDIIVFSTPEDWVGLRERLESSPLTNKAAIIAIIDDVLLAPDGKEQKIRQFYPQDYNYMLANIYPLLRRTDCEINFVVRDFSVNEAKEILKTRPGQLSLNEMYIVAETYETGSDEFNQVFDVAVRMFPEDPVALLNASNTALERRDLVTAKSYLTKTPNSPEKDNAKGVLAMLEDDIDTAYIYLKKAQAAGLAVATENIRQIDERLGKNKIKKQENSKQDDEPSGKKRVKNKK